MNNIDIEIIKEKIEPYVEDFKIDLEEWKKNPDSWSNNKRKMHGYPMRRKGLPKKTKKCDIMDRHMRIMFGLFEEALDEVLSKEVNEKYFNNFVEVKDLSLGDSIPMGYEVYKYGQTFYNPNFIKQTSKDGFC